MADIVIPVSGLTGIGAIVVAIVIVIVAFDTWRVNRRNRL